MANITIRKLEKDEVGEVLYPLAAYAFQASPPLSDKSQFMEFMHQHVKDTCIALFENGKPASAAVSSPMTQQVRGKIFQTSGIWGVATDPTFRRKGYSRKTIQHLLSENYLDGDIFSTLYPFKESFYQRLGYISFPTPRTATFTPADLVPLLKQNLDGRVERVLVGEGFSTYLEFLGKLQKKIHGFSSFSDPDWFSARSNRRWLAIAKSGEETIGVMMYSLEGEEDHPFILRGSRFYFINSQGKYLLLEWIARHADQVGKADILLPSFEQPETWFADLRMRTTSSEMTPMGRIVNISGLGGMVVGPGRFSVKIVDSICPWNEGIWSFDSKEGILSINPSEHWNCELTIQAVTALVYGTHDPGDFSFRNWGQLSDELIDTIQSMFPPKRPYLHEQF
jgi:predicted acetyltransferase